jgi:hypothetical protein
MTRHWLVTTEGGTLTVASDVSATYAPTPPWAVVDDATLASLRRQYDRDPVPQTISPRQARLWLVQHGVTLGQVDEAIASITDTVTRETVQVEWEYGNEVHRSSPWLAVLGPVLGLDDATLDQAFREAATL